MIINLVIKQKIENLNLELIIIAKVIKEMQKKGDFIGLKKLIHKHKTENWHVFLKNLRIKN